VLLSSRDENIEAPSCEPADFDWLVDEGDPAALPPMLLMLLTLIPHSTVIANARFACNAHAR